MTYVAAIIAILFWLFVAIACMRDGDFQKLKDGCPKCDCSDSWSELE